MSSSTTTGRSGATSKASSHATPHGLTPDHQEKDPNSVKSFRSIWDEPVGFSPYLTVKTTLETNKKGFAELSSGKIWKQLGALGIKKVGRVDRKADSLTVNTLTAEDSSRLLDCKEFCGLPVAVTPHSSLNCSRGVIKNGWLKGSAAEELVEDLPNVVRAEQILVKKAGAMVKTGTWILTFNTPTCPTRLDVYWMRLPVRVFIPKPMRCFRCQKFGHLTKHCKAKTETCVRCGAHEKHTDCSKEARCPNCSGPHTASDKACPTYTATQMILRHRAENGGTYASSKEALFPGGTSYSAKLKNNLNQPNKNLNKNNDTQNRSYRNRESSKSAGAGNSSSQKMDSGGFTFVDKSGKHRVPSHPSTSRTSPGAGGSFLSSTPSSSRGSSSTSLGAGGFSSSTSSGGRGSSSLSSSQPLPASPQKKRRKRTRSVSEIPGQPVDTPPVRTPPVDTPPGDAPPGARSDGGKGSGKNNKKNKKSRKNKNKQNKNGSPEDLMDSQEREESSDGEAVDPGLTAGGQPEVDPMDSQERNSGCSESDACVDVGPGPTSEGQPEVDLVLDAESAGPDTTVESTEPNATLASTPGADAVSVVTESPPAIDSVSEDSLVTPAAKVPLPDNDIGCLMETGDMSPSGESSTTETLGSQRSQSQFKVGVGFRGPASKVNERQVTDATDSPDVDASSGS